MPTGLPKNKVEKPKNKSVIRGKNGGKRPGAGRKPGGLNKKTLEQKLVLDEIKQRVMRSKDGLINSQFILAQGYMQIYRIDSTIDKKGYKKKSKPVLVTSVEEITKAIDWKYADGKDPNTDTEYYFVATTPPDNRAIDSLLDRTFGKPAQSMELSNPGGQPLTFGYAQLIREVVKITNEQSTHNTKTKSTKVSS